MIKDDKVVFGGLVVMVADNATRAAVKGGITPSPEGDAERALDSYAREGVTRPCLKETLLLLRGITWDKGIGRGAGRPL